MLPQRRYHRLYKIPEECLVNVFVFAVLGISQIPALKGELHSEKIMICAFLARVMHGKQLGKLSQSEAELGLPLIHLSTPAHVISLQQCYLGAFEGKLVLLAVSEQQQLGIIKAICYSNLVIHTKMHTKS